MSKKEREQRERQIRFQREVEASPQFKAVHAEMSRAAQSARQGLKQRMENNAEYQKRKAMSKDEKAASAIDRMTQSVQTFVEHTTGRKPTHEEAKKEALRIARKALGDV